MVVTTDSGYTEDVTLYGVGSGDVFLPLSIYSGILNLDIDFSTRSKPSLALKDKSVVMVLSVDSDVAIVNGRSIVLPHAVYEYHGKVMIPIKSISSEFGYTVKDTYNKICITKN